MSDHLDDNLENELRDVLAHQAQSVGKTLDFSPRPIDLAEPTPIRRRRRSRAVFGGVAGVIATAAAVTLVVMTVGARPESTTPGEDLAAALAQMADAGNFDVTYDITATQPTEPTITTMAEACAIPYDENFDIADDSREDPATAPVCYSNPVPPLLAQHITGTAVVHLDPFAIESDSKGETFGDVTLHADSSHVWLTVGSSPQSQYLLPDFSRNMGISTLGPRQGPVAMMALASPTGYLTLTQEQAEGATALAETEIEGVHVSEYEVVIPAEQMDDVAGTSEAQAETIQWAVDMLVDQGYTGTTMRIAVGDDGYIYWVLSTANFADGGTAVIDAQFSNFGCAAPVTLPTGQVAGTPNACEGATETSAPDTTTPDTTTPDTTTETTVVPANSLQWDAGHARLFAENFAIDVGGRTFTARDGKVEVYGDPGDDAYQTLELTWVEHDVDMRLYIYFESDGVSWWSNEFRTYNGEEDGDWVTFTGEFFRSPIGEAWSGSVDESAVEGGIESRLRIDGAEISAFVGT